MQAFIHSAWSMVPFALMLLTIAVAPLLADEWWESNKHKLTISLFLGVPTAVCIIMGGMLHELEHQLFGDYIPFIILLLALYVVTGGIHLSGDIHAKPIINTAFLALGWLLASVMGTTGAAMLLIRPLLATNKQRQYKVHTVLFFIALCANCGGLLTPLGDPPLFMLFLRGAEFGWFATMWPAWLFTGIVLMAIYFALDTYYYTRKEQPALLEHDQSQRTPIKLHGAHNFLYLIGIIFTVAVVHSGMMPQMADPRSPMWIRYMREIILFSLTFMSLYTTKRKVRYGLNKFSWGPILEVGVLFLGIFTTMTPALVYLNDHASLLGLDASWQFYYSTGLLSSFLDNTPTAVAFYSVASSLSAEQMLSFGAEMMAGIPAVILRAICIGAVFFGSMTYIGNGPNFMVKAIAEEQGVKMPSFFGYMWRFSLLILLPVYILVQLIFL